jgi:hypothetical protein
MKTNTVSFILISLLTGFAFLRPAQAVVPPPDGGYPGANTAEGTNALLSQTTGGFNAAIGWLSLRDLTTASFNTGVGAGTLALNNGDQNTATGAGALLFNTTGEFNTANGAFALLSNNTGGNNTAIGAGALFSNTTGDGNTATGAGALRVNATGASNTAVGVRALFINDSDNNTAVGYTALLNNTDGESNTAIGYQTLVSNTTGTQQTAVGAGALGNATAGSFNTAVGFGALSDADTGDCIALGAFAGSSVTTASNVIAIGHGGFNVSDTIWVDNIYGVTTQSGTTLPVVVSNQGQLGTVASSRRFKKEVKPMDNASEAVLALKPVTFQYKSDSTGTPQFGLIAEEVAEVNADLVIYETDGKPYAVRYDAVNALLLNEFLKARRQIDAQQKQIDALTAGLQKVSAQLEASKPAPQVVNNQ